MHNNVGNAYRNAGRLNEARSHLEQAKEMMMLIHLGEPVEDMAKVSRVFLFQQYYSCMKIKPQ